MLGQDASFAYIKAVELCASTSISQKRVGYLAASLCFSPNHEFRFMLVNQIQRDMKSTSMLDICAALIAVSKLVTEDMIPAVITDVLNLLKHDSEFVRKHAISALHRFYQMDKRLVLDHTDKIRGAPCDKDPSVMASALPLFQAMIQDDPMAYKDLVPSFVSILKQIVDHCLPHDYDYHRIPSPWIQMNLLRILAILGRGDQSSSEGMYEVLIEVIKRADTGINVGYAIVYECINTVTAIYPNTVLMDAVATAISRFIRSESHNLKYIGIKGLAAIVKDHPRYAADHQLAVIDCLEDSDETLKRKTLDLLFRMTNAVNVEFIVTKLLTFLGSSVDDHFRSELVHQITQCAERFAPSNTWYVQTIIKVFELAGDKVRASVAQTLTQLIAEGAELEDKDEDIAGAKDDELRTEAVEHFLDLLDKPKLPGILAQTMAWVLGEYGYLSPTCSKEDIMDKLCQMGEQAKESETKAYVMTAISKLIAQSGNCPSRVLQTLQMYAQSSSLDVQQRCLEILALLKHSETMVEVLPLDASCEDIEVDGSLSFLNHFVQVALQQGTKPYEVPADFLEIYQGDDDSDKKTSLKITPYELPRIPTVAPGSIGIISTLLAASASSAISNPSNAALPGVVGHSGVAPASMTTAGNSTQAHVQGNQLINTRGNNPFWRRKPQPPPLAPAPAPAPASSPVVPAVGVSSPSSAPVSPVPPADHFAQQQQQQSTPPPPPQPRVLTEKEKMAIALFGGVGGGSGAASSSASSSRRRSTVTNSAPVAAPAPVAVTAAPVPVHAPAPTSSAGMDMFADMTTSSLSPVAAPSASAPIGIGNVAKSNNLMDDLLGIDGAPIPVATHSSTVPVRHVNLNTVSNPSMLTSSHNDLDLLMNMGQISPAPPVSPTPTASNNISEIFANIDLSGAGSISAPVGDGHNVVPYAINTNEFGRRWGSTPVEAKQSVLVGHFPRLDLEALRRAMPTNYHHVESIPQTQESIFAATVTNLGAVVLIHAKIHAPRRSVDLIVKSTAQKIPQRELQHITQAFSVFRG
jgi:AP-4 complex subunit epsilon-1